MTRTDSVYLALAFALNLMNVWIWPIGPRDGMVAFEALGLTLACAIPALLARLVLKRGGYHRWTALLSGLAAFGTWYGATH